MAEKIQESGFFSHCWLFSLFLCFPIWKIIFSNILVVMCFFQNLFNSFIFPPDFNYQVGVFSSEIKAFQVSFSFPQLSFINNFSSNLWEKLASPRPLQPNLARVWAFRFVMFPGCFCDSWVTGMEIFTQMSVWAWSDCVLRHSLGSALSLYLRTRCSSQQLGGLIKSLGMSLALPFSSPCGPAPGTAGENWDRVLQPCFFFF